MSGGLRRQPARQEPGSGLARYKSIITNSYVLLLAPTWIAVNASIGLWFSQSIFQFSKADPRFPDQFLLRGFAPMQITLAAIAVGIVFGAGLIWWGNRFKTIRRTTIIFYGILGGGVMTLGVLAINHALPDFLLVAGAGLIVGAVGPVRARRRDARRRSACWPTSPSGSRPTAARSWASTACSSRSARSPAA